MSIQSRRDRFVQAICHSCSMNDMACPMRFIASAGPAPS